MLTIFVPCKSISEFLAFNFHVESDWYKYIIVWSILMYHCRVVVIVTGYKTHYVSFKDGGKLSNNLIQFIITWFIWLRWTFGRTFTCSNLYRNIPLYIVFDYNLLFKLKLHKLIYWWQVELFATPNHFSSSWYNSGKMAKLFLLMVRWIRCPLLIVHKISIQACVENVIKWPCYLGDETCQAVSKQGLPSSAK